MIQMKRIFCSILLLSVFAASAFCETVLTVDDAVKKALSDNRNIQQESITLSDRERSVKNRWNIFLPEITASAGLGRNNEILENSPDATWNGRVSGAVSLTLGTDFPYKISRIKKEYESGSIDYENARRNLEVAVRESFCELLIYERDIALVKENLEANRKRYDQALVNQEAGLVPELDVLNARLAWTRLIPEHDALETEYSRKLDLFKISLGMDSSETVVLDGDIDTLVPENIDFSAVPAEIETPVLRSLKAELEISESSRRELQGSSLFPELTLGWDITPVWPDVTASGDYSDNGSFSAGLRWRLDNLVPNSDGDLKIKQLRDNSEKLRLQIAEEQADSESAVRNLISEISRGQETVKTLEMTAEIAGRTLELTEDAYRYGVKDILDVSEAQQTLHEAELDILRQKYEIYRSMLELEYKLNLSFGTLGG